MLALRIMDCLDDDGVWKDEPSSRRLDIPFGTGSEPSLVRRTLLVPKAMVLAAPTLGCDGGSEQAIHGDGGGSIDAGNSAYTQGFVGDDGDPTVAHTV